MGIWNWLKTRWAQQLPPGHVRWATLTVPPAYTNYHFLAAGTTGSGKTTLLRMLLRSILPAVGSGTDVRVILYDRKVEAYTELVDLKLRDHTHILNPFDRRAVAWDIAKDIVDEADAREFATLMIPEAEGPNSYFFKAARLLLKTALLALMEVKPRCWTLRDVMLACANLNDLQALFEVTKDKLPVSLDDFYSAEREARAVRMTLTVENDNYNVLAAAWELAQRRISLQDWVASESVLLLGSSRKYPTALATVNRLLVQRANQVLFDYRPPRPNRNRRTWIFLDEFPSLGRIPTLEEFLTEGRSKGICVVLGFQHIAHVRRCYGDLTEALLGQCHHEALFKAKDFEMAAWCASRFAPLIDYDERKPWQIEKQTPGALLNDFMELQPASARAGFECIVQSIREILEAPMQVRVTPRQGPPPVPEAGEDDEDRAAFLPWPEPIHLKKWSAAERQDMRLPAQVTPGPQLSLPVVTSTVDDVPW